jgi:hypothetical protein
VNLPAKALIGEGFTAKDEVKGVRGLRVPVMLGDEDFSAMLRRLGLGFMVSEL